MQEKESIICANGINLFSHPLSSLRIRKRAKIWNRYNQAPHLTQDTNGKLTTSQDKSQPSNYRPVALLSCIGKLQERIVFKNLYNFLLDNILFYKYQSGFLPHHSAVFQLIDIFHNMCQAFDNNMFSCIVFCDVSKAFDSVWHKGILFKLRQNGIEGKLLEWLNSY